MSEKYIFYKIMKKENEVHFHGHLRRSLNFDLEASLERKLILKKINDLHFLKLVNQLRFLTLECLQRIHYF